MGSAEGLRLYHSTSSNLQQPHDTDVTPTADMQYNSTASPGLNHANFLSKVCCNPQSRDHLCLHDSYIVWLPNLSPLVQSPGEELRCGEILDEVVIDLPVLSRHDAGNHRPCDTP
jgi:hypothetical protein